MEVEGPCRKVYESENRLIDGWAYDIEKPASVKSNVYGKVLGKDSKKEGIHMREISKLLLIGVFLLAACSPEVGSKAWCEDMKKKPKGDWTTNEAADFAKHCLLQSPDE